MIFVDTGGWYALFVDAEPRHAKIVNWVRENRQRLITTDYVIDETLTLLRARGEFDKALEFGNDCLTLSAWRVHYLDNVDIQNAWHVFRANPNRGWSFTDCTSKVVMDRYHIKQALGFDRHFLEFGNVTLVP